MRNPEPVRLDPEQSERVELVLRSADGAWPGALRLCDAGGLSARFPDNPALCLGSAVRLVLSAETLSPPVELEARIESRTESEGGREYGLCFLRRHEAETRLLPGLRALLERRGASRVQADPEQPLLVTLEAPGLPRLAAQLASLSPRGLELRVPAEDEARWVAVERARALLALPGAALALAVELRTRRLAGRHALLGLELAAPVDDAQRAAAAELARLVEARRAALQRRRAG